MDSLDTDKPTKLASPSLAGNSADELGPYLRLPSVISAVRETARSKIQRSLNQLFTQCQPAFESLAKSARSNNEQAEMFAAPGVIRRERSAIQERFTRQFEQHFIALESTRPAIQSPAQQHSSELGLVDDAAMDYSVALAKMVTRARVDNREQLYALERRLEAVLQSGRIEDQNNPLDPAQLGEAFQLAIEPLELSMTAKIVLFRQFDRLLCRQLPELYDAANEHLVDAGFLPEIHHELRKEAENEALTATPPNPPNATPAAQVTDSSTHAASSAQPAEPPVLTTGIGPNGEVMEFNRDFGELSQLLDKVRDAASAGQPGIPLFTSPGQGPALTQQEFHSLLSDLQREAHAKSQSGALWQPQLDLRSLLTTSLQQRENSGEKSKLGKTDEDVINLIAMFFDFVLDDKHLPLQVQALISRLQIPLLKIALRDKSFFSSAKHPLRRLINEIVAAGVGLNDRDAQKRDSLVEQLTDVVHDVQANYEDDEAVFSRNLDLLQEQRQRDEQRAQKVALRSSESAAAEARTQHSKALIEQLVLERLIDIEVPQAVQNFAIGEWQQVLLLTRLKHGNDSAEWLDAVQTLDDLIWTSLRHEDEKSLLRLQQMLPELQTRLISWLSQTKASETEARDSLEDVIQLQSQLLSDEAGQSLQRDRLGKEYCEALSTEEPAEDKPWREMTAVERQQMQYQALTYDFIKQADKLPIGSWLVFTRPNGSSVRCRLAARLAPNDSLVFVDRFGFKTLLKKRREFAQELQEGQARRVLQDGFFDRMMNKVSDQLHSRSSAVPNSYETA